MQPTADFIQQAQSLIDSFFRSRRDRLMAAHGNIAEEVKSDNSPVTELDKLFEQELRVELAKFDASIGFMGEEFGKEGSESTFWLIDPIDGTENFIRGLPGVKHMVTLVADNEPVYAYVYKPVSDELFVATKGKGTFKNGQRMQVSQRPLDRCWIELSSPLDDESVWPLIKAVSEKINAFRIMGDHTYIVQGMVDGGIVYKGQGGLWDYAPRALLLSEAGAKVANLGTDTYDFRNFDTLALHPAAFDELMPVIAEVLKGSV